jgi:putative ABC transport system permease protein
MFLALRELRHARLRYLLIGAIITLIAWLVFLLSGLANGLANDNGGAVRAMPATGVVFQQGSQLLLQRSSLPASTLDKVAAVPGVTAATPLGLSMVNVQRAGGDRLAATIMAIDPAGFLAPTSTEGRALLDAGSGEVIVDHSLAEEGVHVGDTLLVQPSGAKLIIAGFTTGRTYSHLPVIYMPLSAWQSLQADPAAFGAFGVSNAPGTDVSTPAISAVAVQSSADALARITTAVPDVEVGTLSAVIGAVPGYAEESGTLTMIQGFLVVMAAFIIAAFFYVLTLQKTSQFGVLKVIGASTAVLGRDLIGQVLLLTTTGIIAGALLSLGVAQVIPGGVPFLLEAPTVALYAGVLLVVALLGALLSLRRIAGIDALTAIGRAD